MPSPRVTVICLCHNQGRFVREAIQSVLGQTYSNIQLLVVDAASTDNSVKVISECLAARPEIRFIALAENCGNCKAFNQALQQAEGEYIIDLAADDVLLPDRVRKGVMSLAQAGDPYGVNFCDADWISEEGGFKHRHSDRFPHNTIPEGDIYRDLIARFFICSPTMIFKRRVIESLGGYDESLSYEDFDFWIRSSRIFHYCYTPEVMVQKRIVEGSMSQKQFSIRSPQLRSTFRVCEKIMALNKSVAEQKALARRLLYETRVCMQLMHFPLVLKYAGLYLKNNSLRYERAG